MRTRVKICGITRIEDALAAVHAGTDAIGLVFSEQSPRCVSLDRAEAIARALPPFVTVVGLFVNAEHGRIDETLSRVALDLLQFHGSEPPEQCRRYRRPYIKAISMKPDVNLPALAALYADAAGLLLDSDHPTLAGGSGAHFDWARVPRGLTKPVILAGGLTPANVAEAIRIARPYAVDVSSGVEQSKGIKDSAKMTDFIRNASGVV